LLMVHGLQAASLQIQILFLRLILNRFIKMG